MIILFLLLSFYIYMIMIMRKSIKFIKEEILFEEPKICTVIINDDYSISLLPLYIYMVMNQINNCLRFLQPTIMRTAMVNWKS